MSTPTKAPPSSASDLGLILVNCNNFDSGAIEQQIELASAGFALSALIRSRFPRVCRREQARELVSINCAMRAAVASFNSTATIAEVSMTIRRAARAGHSRGSHWPSAYRDPAATHSACRFRGFRRPGCARLGGVGTRCSRSSAALRTAVVTVSPVSAASSRTDFSVARSLMLSGIALWPRRIFLPINTLQNGGDRTSGTVTGQFLWSKAPLPWGSDRPRRVQRRYSRVVGRSLTLICLSCRAGRRRGAGGR